MKNPPQIPEEAILQQAATAPNLPPVNEAWRPTVNDITAMLKLPADHEEERAEYAASVLRALDIVRAFAQDHDWSRHMQEPYFHGIEIFSTREQLWHRILELNAIVDDISLPTDGLTAALEGGVLVAVVKEEAQLARPEYFINQTDYDRALAHEIVHRLHIRLLDGNEEAMGPGWFFEGFAIYGSGQILGADIEIKNLGEALALTKAAERGAYAQFAAAFRWLAQRVPLDELVRNAAAQDFIDHLRSRLQQS